MAAPRFLLAIFAFAAAVACGGDRDPAAPASYALRVSVGGLPDGAPASVTVSGPNGYNRMVTRTDTLRELRRGSYTLTAGVVSVGDEQFAASPAAQTITLRASAAQGTAAVSYAIMPGELIVAVAGLPAGGTASITVSNSAGYSRAVTRTDTLVGLAPGSYTIAAQSVQSSGHTYAPTPPAQNRAVASAARSSATVTYSQTTGTLAIAIGGLPSNAEAAVSLTGPDNYARSVKASEAITGLVPGTYTLTAAPVTHGGTSYTPSPVVQTADVAAGETVNRSITYSGPSNATLNLWIEGMYITQSSQTFASAVPLVQGRDGFLRVFVRANEQNNVRPAVRVRLFHGAMLARTYTLQAPGLSVPRDVNETPLTTSWNVAVPGTLIVPGLRILADVDPENTIAESNESDNAMPQSGIALQLDVRAAQPFRAVLVPVVTSSNGLVGNVNTGNRGDYTAFAMAVYPLPGVEADVRAPYTTTDTSTLQSDNGNGAWSRILGEINALRLAAGDTRHYYGVVRTPYSSGIVGIGYVGGRAALGYDNSSNRGWVAAHEWGHNFNRRHAPCGSASGVDPNFPYQGGRIGVFGFDLGSSALRDTSWSDLMGYCGNRWISDYTYAAVLNHRGTAAAELPAAGAVQPALLVWGRIENGRVILEPAFEVTTRPQPPRGGAYRVELLDGLGATIETHPFDADELSHAPGERHFGFTIPLGAAMRTRVQSLRVSGRGIAPVVAAKSSRTPATVLAESVPAGMRLTWDANRHPMLLITDPRTGEVLSFARGGQATIATSARAVDVHASDGVSSSRQRVQPDVRR